MQSGEARIAGLSLAGGNRSCYSQAMTLLDQLGVALGLATLAGVNLYLTVLVAGLAVHFHWLDLADSYEQLAVLGNTWVIGEAAALFLIEFFADKIPMVDSAWDSLHTLIRPAGGILLALTALGGMDPVVLTIGALLAGAASLSTHGAKAGVRAVVNLSPEPVSNSIASVTEDGFVLGGLALIGLVPTIALFVFIGVVALCAAFAAELHLLNECQHVIRRRMTRRHSGGHGDEFRLGLQEQGNNPRVIIADQTAGFGDDGAAEIRLHRRGKAGDPIKLARHLRLDAMPFEESRHTAPVVRILLSVI